MASKYATYKIVSIHDPALIQPELPELDLAGLAPDGYDDSEIARRREAHQEAVQAAYDAWLERLRGARERQDWDGLLVDKAQPAYLVMRWIPDDVRGWWQDQRRDNGGTMGHEESLRYLVRLALAAIEGARPRTFKATRLERIDWEVADRACLDELKAIVGGEDYPAWLLSIGRQIHEQEARGRPL